MARTLETLELGTPVYCGEEMVGGVRGLYSEGESRAVEWVIVGWPERGDIAVPATEVETIDARGVILMHSDKQFYADLPAFSEARFPTVHKLG